MLGRTLALCILVSFANICGCTPHRAEWPYVFRPQLTSNTREFRSPSGGYSLCVSSSSLSGGAGAHYDMKCASANAWERTLPFTLWDCAISESGAVLGYAYPLPDTPQSPVGVHAGSLLIALIDSKGQIVKEYTRTRTPSGIYEVPATPWVKGLIPRHDLNLVTIRVAESPTDLLERWETYSLVTGERVNSVSLRWLPVRVRGAVVSATHLPGTEYTLLHVVGDVRTAPNLSGLSAEWGALFCLVNHDGRAIWTVTWERDYEYFFSDSSRMKLIYEGLGTNVDGRRQFRIFSALCNEWIRFQVTLADDVQEIDRVSEERARVFSHAQQPSR